MRDGVWLFNLHVGRGLNLFRRMWFMKLPQWWLLSAATFAVCWLVGEVALQADLCGENTLG